VVIEKSAFKIFRRAFVKPFGIAGFLLALVGGALIGYSALAILVFTAGILGIIGAAIKPAWWKFWKR